MIEYKNGNASVIIYDNGTRIISFDDDVLNLEYPLNIDIRVSTKCSFGLNPKTKKAFCTFCHESAKTDGVECNYDDLKNKLIGLPGGIELAIGANEVTNNLINFISWCKEQNYIVNLTVNQGHLIRDKKKLLYLINNNFIYGLGISYRGSLKFNIPESLLNYENTVIHVIAGIDNFSDVENLYKYGVKKILVLGEKDFGFNYGKVDLTTKVHQKWFWFIHKLFDKFSVVSFDNLALEQLKIKRFFTNKNWDIFNQGEHSMYIQAVDGYFSPSSRSKLKTDWTQITIKDYFSQLEENR